MKTPLLLAAALFISVAHAEDPGHSNMGLKMFAADEGADFGIDALWVDTSPGTITLIVKRTDTPPIFDDFAEDDTPIKRMGDPRRIDMEVLADSTALSSSSSVRPCAMHAVMIVEEWAESYVDQPKIELDRSLAETIFGSSISSIALSQEQVPVAVLTDNNALAGLAMGVAAWMDTLPAYEAPPAVEVDAAADEALVEQLRSLGVVPGLIPGQPPEGMEMAPSAE